MVPHWMFTWSCTWCNAEGSLLKKGARWLWRLAVRLPHMVDLLAKSTTTEEYLDVRQNIRRYVRKNVRRYVRNNGRRYVRQNVRRGKSDRMSGDMSEEMSERMPERMSEDMSERMSEDTSV